MKEKQYFKELEKIENNFYELTRDFDLNFPMPINFKEEKKEFFACIADDLPYNPKFKYEKKEFDQEKIKQLENFNINTENDIYGFKKLYKERLKTKLQEIYCHQNWGKVCSTKHVIRYRGKPGYILFKKALKYARKYKREKVKFRTLTLEEVKAELKNEVERLTENKIRVYFRDINSKINIVPTNNYIQINQNERFRSIDIKRLKIHEIGVHYMRYVNGHNMGIKILEVGTSNYIETEEGLAAYVEELKGVSSKAQMFVYAGRVIATYYTTRKSFYEIFSILRGLGFKDDVAFAITFRAKRNICDTSEKGGFTKDYVYFSGYLKIKKFSKRNDITDLFIGKIKLEDIKTLRKYIDKNKDKIRTVLD